MASAVTRLLRSPELRQQLVECGLREVRRYTWTAVRDTLFAGYTAAVQNGVAPMAAR